MALQGSLAANPDSQRYQTTLIKCGEPIYRCHEVSREAQQWVCVARENLWYQLGDASQVAFAVETVPVTTFGSLIICQ